MGDPDFVGESLPSLAGLIDHLCDEFERGWRQNLRPTIEEYLARVSAHQRRELFQELVGIELHWRQERDEKPTVDEYRRRFPDYSELLEQEIRTHHGHRLDTLPELAVGTSSRIDQPRRFGGYDVLAEIGRGGMGVVYRANQRSAQRVVALKVISRERLESLPEEKRREIRERFRNEAQATAQLQHDHLVTVYEVGEVDGQPFFSMQLVDGSSLAEILRQGPLDNATAARHLESTSRAVHQAHLSGILHRDLKPQNVMVDRKTDRALVVDFGLAKLLEQTDQMTRTGEIVGTPSYMSPEQVQNASQVSVRTDVYALGATLYDVLTARPPFEAATPLETLRQVTSEEPVPPRRLNPAIDRDLETICLKCLHKDPNRRYASALELADDLGRYRQHQPIHAKRIGIVGRAWRWSRRNPWVALLAMIAGGSLLLTLVVFIAAYRSQKHSLQVTREAHARSDESFRDAVETVKRLCVRVSEETLLNQPGMQPLRRELLREALQYFEKFSKQRTDAPTLRADLAAAHVQIGMITEELESPDKALPSYERARQVQRQLMLENPRDQARQVALATTANRVGRAYHRMQQLEPAREAHQEALQIREDLAASAPTNAEYQRSLANSLMNIGLVDSDQERFNDAERQLERAQSIRKKLFADNPNDASATRDLAQGCFNSAHLAVRRSMDEQAVQYLREAIGLFQSLANRNPVSQDDLYRLAICYRMLADREAVANHPIEAADHYRQAAQVGKRLVEVNPGVVPYRTFLAGVHMNEGQSLSERGDSKAALLLILEAVTLLDLAVEQHPELPANRRDLAVALRVAGELQAKHGDDRAARNSLNRARQELEDLLREYPDNADYAEQRDATDAILSALHASASSSS